MKNIIIFGASKFGEKVFNYYQKDADINILSFCDNDVNKHSTLLFGKKIISPSKLLETDFDEIVIASSYEKAIQEQLFDMKIDKEKIKIFHTNFEEIQLKNENLLAISESLMFDIAQLFNENNINYHIDHGTLLGLIRDSQILPWDIDIDFAILFDEEDNVLNILKNYLSNYKNRYSLKNNWEFFVNKENIDLEKNEKQTMYITIVNNIGDTKNTIGLDIHIKYPKDEKLLWMVAQRRLSATKSFCFPTKEFIFKKQTLKVPNNSDNYLKELYGEWKTPVKKWDYSQYSNIDNYVTYEGR